jgi:hypothetical protein
MVARLTSISSSIRIRHQEVAGSSPAVVGYLRVNSIVFLPFRIAFAPIQVSREDGDLVVKFLACLFGPR